MLIISECMHAKNKEFCPFLVYSFESNQLGKPSFKKENLFDLDLG